MERRDFIKYGGAIAAGTALNKPARAEQKIQWKMVTTWPKTFAGLSTSANNLAAMIEEMSGGRLAIKVYAANEMVPSFHVFDTVARGTAQMGHGMSMYWKGKVESAQFFTGIPFGLTAQEMNGWLYYGGGLDLWREIYEPFGLVPEPAGNTGAQMAGWFNKRIDSVKDLQGLKFRVPGLGGEVLRRAGGVAVNTPENSVVSALKSGTLDALQWIAPFNDLALGLHKVAKYYYYPGWQQPSSTVEVLVNQKALAALDKDLQAIVRNACRASNDTLLAEYTAMNISSLRTLRTQNKIEILRLPDDILKKFRTLSDEVIADSTKSDPNSKRIMDSILSFREQAAAWHDISERAYLNARA